jgi:hypothetical protein
MNQLGYLCGEYKMNEIQIGVLILLAFVNIVSLFLVSNKPTPRRVLWTGAVLVVSGLGGSLFMTPSNESSPALFSYLSNICLLVAGLGGNFIVGAAVMKTIRATGTVSGVIVGDIHDPSNTTKQVGKLSGRFTGDTIEN